MKFTENCQRLLHELVSQKYIENGNGVNEAHFFELFVAQQITKAYDLSDEEIESCVLGGGNDGGCDAIFVLQNGNLITEDEIDDVKNLKNSVIYNGPQNQDHVFQKHRERGMIQQMQRRDDPCHEAHTQQHSRRRLSWRYSGRRRSWAKSLQSTT